MKVQMLIKAVCRSLDSESVCERRLGVARVDRALVELANEVTGKEFFSVKVIIMYLPKVPGWRGS